jgi:hypothetical protein
MAGGRPTDFREEFCQQAAELLANGATDEEVAAALGVSARTLYRWQAKHPEFSQALKVGKEAPDERTVRSLYQKATGFYFVEQQAFKVKEVTYVDGKRCEAERIEVAEVERYQPPDTTACIFWLKNRDPGNWRDKQEHEHRGSVTIERIERVVIGAEEGAADRDAPRLPTAH